MNEENENQPPLETESAPPEQRRRRPRRRYPRRRYYDRGDRGENSGNPTAITPIRPRGDTATAALDRQGADATEGGDQAQTEPEFGKGIIEISGKGFGFLRDPKRNFVQTPQDIFVTPEIVRRFGLRDGMWIHGETRRGNRGPQLTNCWPLTATAAKYHGLRPFEELTTINPNKRINLETVPERYTTRIMDLMTPLGMGQRGLIVAPPRTGQNHAAPAYRGCCREESSGDQAHHSAC